MKKGSKRDLNIVRVCYMCNNSFKCADPKSNRCNECKSCIFCGIKTRTESRVCIKCRAKNQTVKQKEQQKELHKSMFGANNPSKRIDVRKKLSDSKMGDRNPARIYREQYAIHIRKYRPGKISKLEKIVEASIPHLKPQFEIDNYVFDFAEPELKIAIEIQGCWFHSCQICFPSSPTFPTQFYCKKNDLKKKKVLEDNGWTLIEIAEHEIRKKSADEIAKIYQEKKTSIII